MPLRIGFDLDGVLADMDAALLHEAERVFGKAPGDSEDDTAPDIKRELDPRRQRRLWRHVETIENFWQSLEEIEPGTIARLAQLAHDRRWEIIFLTKRPDTEGATVQVQSQRWLESKGFALPSVFVVQGSRGRVAAALALDVVVDDRPENCLDVVVDSHAKAILVWRDTRNSVPAAAQRLGIGIVASVEECLDVLVGLDAPMPHGESLLSRFKRLFGVKQRADV